MERLSISETARRAGKRKQYASAALNGHAGEHARKRFELIQSGGPDIGPLPPVLPHTRLAARHGMTATELRAAAGESGKPRSRWWMDTAITRRQPQRLAFIAKALHLTLTDLLQELNDHGF